MNGCRIIECLNNENKMNVQLFVCSKGHFLKKLNQGVGPENDSVLKYYGYCG